MTSQEFVNQLKKDIQAFPKIRIKHPFLKAVSNGTATMDQKEKKRKRALIVLQIVIYGYLLTMFGIQLYMSFARGWWDL